MTPELEHTCQVFGHFLRRDALKAGYNERSFHRLTRSGTLIRIRPGAYTTIAMWEAMSGAQRYAARSRAAARSARTDVVLSHTSSLAMLTDKWWDLPLDEVHLTRRDGRVGRREAGVRQHSGLILPGDVELDGELERMNPTRTALEVATLVDFERALCVINSLLHEGLTTVERLRHSVVDMQHWPHTLNQEVLLTCADPRVESIGETRTFCALRRAGYPRPEPQHEVRNEAGKLVARLDFVIWALGIWIEFDGKEKYLRFRRPGESVADAILREKRRERMVARLTRLECARLDWYDIEHPARLTATVDEAIAAAAHRRTA
ncbi:type IV toxin-antitoxin system AbiEi family antitoxin domain-containing protein [Nocardioides rotundus]|uniref:type IV toxin-antitoxin system AbiEi family antitoxin domain-containing protein n=1 Tax=Nocardioides rotundus TaxID=1774216 RepID=UPI001CBA81B4|nr:type IV toxin-antitoxin system AbiEi family antitoxin domain-containing protein [Nocardioides rotundus]UAL28680.1 type IV toxin-antitoxin system AbiEi family antitoxin domain-containing protein [Nocardioides rotundus]